MYYAVRGYYSIHGWLFTAEIIKEVETNGDGLTELLRFNTEQLEPQCLNAALKAAVSNDNHYNVGKLIVKGADKIKESLKQSLDEKKPHARAMLLLVHAAMEGNRNLVLRLFGELATNDGSREFDDELCPPHVGFIHRDLAAVLIDDDIVGDAQTQAGSLPHLLRCKEGVEDPSGDLLGNPQPRITDTQRCIVSMHQIF